MLLIVYKLVIMIAITINSHLAETKDVIMEEDCF
jgi:hypothetical protein